MTILSQVDSTADIACALAPDAALDRVVALGDLVGEGTTTSRSPDALAIRIERRGRPGLDADVAAWAGSEKACCPFFGFALVSEPDAVTLQVFVPAGAEATLDELDRLLALATSEATP
jgi:hypothetical protein